MAQTLGLILFRRLTPIGIVQHKQKGISLNNGESEFDRDRHEGLVQGQERDEHDKIRTTQGSSKSTKCPF